MPIREELERSGNWLFRRRGYLPLAVLVVLLSQLPKFSYLAGSHTANLAWGFLCLLLGLHGVAIRVHVVGHAPYGTSGRNLNGHEAAELNTTGWYSVVRHPLYLGNLLIWMAVALFPHIWWLTLLTAFAFALYYERIMFAEEEWLRREFGPPYLEWAGRTPAILPNLRRWLPAKLPFSLRNALGREFSGMFGLVATLTVMEVGGDWVVTHRFHVDTGWGVLFGLAAVSYLVLRHLKRHTTVLSVPGR